MPRPLRPRHKSHQAMVALQKCQKKEPPVTCKTLSYVARMQEGRFLKAGFTLMSLDARLDLSCRRCGTGNAPLGAIGETHTHYSHGDQNRFLTASVKIPFRGKTQKFPLAWPPQKDSHQPNQRHLSRRTCHVGCHSFASYRKACHARDHAASVWPIERQISAIKQ